MEVFDNIFTDCGSRYAGSDTAVTDRDEVKAVLKALVPRKKSARASHHSWAALLPDGPAKGDDGEASAGAVMILQELDDAGLTGHVAIVTRWFVGIHLGGERLRRVAEAVEYCLAHRGAAQ